MPNQQQDSPTNITVSGSGASASGHSVASGAGGLAIGGNVVGDLVLPPQPYLRPPNQALSMLPKHVPRPTEEAQIKAMLLRDKEKEGTSSMLAIEGMGGVGKSWLIAAVARDPEVINHFKDGILWADLGRDVNVLDRQNDWAIALGGSTFGYDPRQVHDKQNKTGLLRTLLRDKVCLLVINDAWKPTDVEALSVGGQDCYTVITTRVSKIADSIGADRLHLGVMTPEEAESLLRKWAGAELEGEDTELIAELAKRLGYLPLALGLAGAQIRSGIDLEEVLDCFRQEQGVDLSVLDLEDPETKRESLQIAFNLSLAHLDEQKQRYYKQLGVFAAEADFDVTAAAAIWGIKEFPARKILHRLKREALLDLSKRNTDRPAQSDNVYNVYRLHILLRDYARDKLDNDERRTAADRHLDHYWNICCKLAGLEQMPEEAPLEQMYVAWCHAVEMKDPRAIDFTPVIGTFPPKKRVDPRLRRWQRPYELDLTGIGIPRGVGREPPAAIIPNALAATIGDILIDDRPTGSFAWTSGGHMDVEPT